MSREKRMQKALKAIDAIVKAYYSGRIIVTTEKNGYTDDMVGLDIIMAIIKNNIIDAMEEVTKRKEGYLYV